MIRTIIPEGNNPMWAVFSPGWINASLIFILSPVMTGFLVYAEEGDETAQYRTVLQEGAFEIRRYADLSIIRTDMKWNTGLGRSSSFMKLAGYISRKNEDEREIAMTTPVFEKSGKNGREMVFVLPPEFQGEGSLSPPTPSSKDVLIDKWQEGLYAAYRYTGPTSKSIRGQIEGMLGELAVQNGYKTQGEAIHASYSSPMVPREKRIHEVLFAVSVDPSHHEKMKIEALTFDLGQNQSMLITGKGFGQDAALNTWLGQDSVVQVQNLAEADFTARIESGNQTRLMTVPAESHISIDLKANSALFFDSVDQARAKVSFSGPVEAKSSEAAIRP